jgi:hypothetical protein
MSLTPPGGEFSARESLVSGGIPAGGGKIINLFLQCMVSKIRLFISKISISRAGIPQGTYSVLGPNFAFEGFIFLSCCGNHCEGWGGGRGGGGYVLCLKSKFHTIFVIAVSI